MVEWGDRFSTFHPSPSTAQLMLSQDLCYLLDVVQKLWETRSLLSANTPIFSRTDFTTPSASSSTTTTPSALAMSPLSSSCSWVLSEEDEPSTAQTAATNSSLDSRRAAGAAAAAASHAPLPAAAKGPATRMSGRSDSDDRAEGRRAAERAPARAVSHASHPRQRPGPGGDRQLAPTARSDEKRRQVERVKTRTERSRHTHPASVDSGSSDCSSLPSEPPLHQRLDPAARYADFRSRTASLRSPRSTRTHERAVSEARASATPEAPLGAQFSDARTCAAARGTPRRPEAQGGATHDGALESHSTASTSEAPPQPLSSGAGCGVAASASSGPREAHLASPHESTGAQLPLSGNAERHTSIAEIDEVNKALDTNSDSPCLETPSTNESIDNAVKVSSAAFLHRGGHLPATTRIEVPLSPSVFVLAVGDSSQGVSSVFLFKAYVHDDVHEHVLQSSGQFAPLPHAHACTGVGSSEDQHALLLDSHCRQVQAKIVCCPETRVLLAMGQEKVALLEDMMTFVLTVTTHDASEVHLVRAFSFEGVVQQLRDLWSRKLPTDGPNSHLRWAALTCRQLVYEVACDMGLVSQGDRSAQALRVEEVIAILHHSSLHQDPLIEVRIFNTNEVTTLPRSD